MRNALVYVGPKQRPAIAILKTIFPEPPRPPTKMETCADVLHERYEKLAAMMTGLHEEVPSYINFPRGILDTDRVDE